jgi:NTE family protein
MRYHISLKADVCIAAFIAQSLILQLPAFGQAENDQPLVQSISQDTSTIAVPQTTSKRLKIGLALGGGGTRGAAHIGVLRVLQKEGIPIDYVAGTSIGAIVGGLYCAGASLDDIEKMVARNTLKRAYFTVPLWFRVALVPVFLVPNTIHHHYDGLYRGKKFATFLNKSVGIENQKIENFKTPFCAIAASLSDGQSHTIKTGDLGTALQASSAIPILRRPVEMNDDLFVDGGIVNNLPVAEVRAMGADIVIAVNVDEKLTGHDLKQFKKIGSVGNRVINMILCRVDSDRLKEADVLIHPDVNNISLLSMKKNDAYRAIKAGTTAAEASLAKIREAMEKPRESKLDAAVFENKTE